MYFMYITNLTTSIIGNACKNTDNTVAITDDIAYNITADITDVITPDITSHITTDSSDNGALTSLNLAANNLGELVLEGWSTKDKGRFWQRYIHVDGREQKEDPGFKPEGIIAIANAIPDMGALIRLDISNNAIGAEQKESLERICVASSIDLAM
jgi:hypothetical protein